MRLNFKLRSTLLSLLLSLIPAGCILAQEFTAFSGQITGQGINVRTDATVGSTVICTLVKGELVDVVGEAHGWYKIRLPKEAPSYIKKDLLECNNVNADFAAKPDRCLSAKVIKERVNIRLAPTESSWILGKVQRGTVVNIISERGDWYKIHPVYQSYGWVNKQFISKDIVVVVVAPEKKELALKPTEEIKPQDLLSVEGKVSPYGIVLWRKATHKLITPENKIYFLKGNRKGLDSLNYHKVRVRGRLISDIASRYPIIQIEMIEALN